MNLKKRKEYLKLDLRDFSVNLCFTGILTLSFMRFFLGKKEVSIFRYYYKDNFIGGMSFKIGKIINYLDYNRNGILDTKEEMNGFSKLVGMGKQEIESQFGFFIK